MHGEPERSHVCAQQRVLDAREVLDQRAIGMAEGAESEEARHEDHHLHQPLPSRFFNSSRVMKPRSSST